MLGRQRPLAASATSVPRFTQLTFRAGTLISARFAPDGQTIVYSAAWQGGPQALYMVRQGNPESRPLGIEQTKLVGISSSSELAFLRASHFSPLLYSVAAPLARVADRRRATRVLEESSGRTGSRGRRTWRSSGDIGASFPPARPSTNRNVRSMAGASRLPGIASSSVKPVTSSCSIARAKDCTVHGLGPCQRDGLVTEGRRGLVLRCGRHRAADAQGRVDVRRCPRAPPDASGHVGSC